MTDLDQGLSRLIEVLNNCRPVAVAVSGGVDSMTLAHIAHLVLDEQVRMFHAISPAVPASATERVKDRALRHGWRLKIVNAGEFVDERYLSNPANRCFFCKSNLYGVLASLTRMQILSGTNVDDLGDWRPGLKAAEANQVRHPFVEAGMKKADVRATAAAYGLEDIAELPSAPCLSSRIETGIRIDPEVLKAIDIVEAALRDTLRPETVRCRVRADGVVIELDSRSLAALDDLQRETWAQIIRARFGAKPVQFKAYQRGSAFLRESFNERG